MLWCAFADAVPLYPLYALLFADSGLSAAEISGLLALWSLVALVSEVPSGAWADRYSRRSALVAASALQGAGYLLWIALPGLPGFAAGFVLWGVGGSLASGSFEALLYDGLAAAGAADRYAAVLGRAEAASLAVQVPIAGVASALFALGGYTLAGAVSVGVCLAAAGVAATLTDVRPPGGGAPRAGYLAGMRAGVAEAVCSAPVRWAALAVALLWSLDGLEEYFPLIAAGWGVSVGLVPLALLAIPLVGALGAVLGERAARLCPMRLLGLMLVASAALAGAGALAHPAGLAGVALFYGLFRLVMVVADTRLQERIDGPSRATVTSVAGMGGELASVALYGSWALGGLGLVTVLAMLCALALAGLGPAAARGGPAGAGERPEAAANLSR